MILADVAPTVAQWNGFWVVAAFGAFFLANLATVGAFIMASRKQKREVTFGFIPASKDEFDKHVAKNEREHENLFSKIGGVERGGLARMDAISKEWRGFVDGKFDDMAVADNSGREKLHERINEILKEVGELRGEMRHRK